MTDAKSRLRPLDRLETPDLWRRATTLDPRSEMDEVASGHRSPKRSIAGIVAFAVFIAAGAFAWQALHPVTRPEAAFGPIEGTILWPERTTAALASAQSLADSGDPSVAWRLDPNEVATRFAEFVLGWGSPGSGYTVSTTQEGASAATVVVSRLPVHCPALAPRTTASCPPPFAEETLTLRQAGRLGETGVWSVASVRASGLDLKLDPGDVIQNGGTIEARWHLPAAGRAVEGFAASAGYEMGPGYPCGGGERRGPIRSDGSIRIDVYSTPGALFGTHCGPLPASYAWIATSVIPRVPRGEGNSMFFPVPLYQGSSTPTPPTSVLYGLTVVPMLVSLPGTE
jgi:hypothetical protein